MIQVFLLFSHQSKEDEETPIKEGHLLITWFRNSSLVPNFKHGKADVLLYSTTKKLDSKEYCKVSILGFPISSDSKHAYLGVTLDNHLTLAEQSAKILKKVSQRIKLSKRV